MGCLFFLGPNLANLTNTMFAATFFGANINLLTYAKEYFNPFVQANPLLHLWSLGVEEQFYILWPLIISIVVKLF
jgi:peptidoglycan/LPS O-acetylase OafA/YrhL